MHVIHKMLFPALSSRCREERGHLLEIFLFVCIYLVCMHLFTENLVGFHFTSYNAYCNKPPLPLLYKKGNRRLKLQSKMMLFRGHTFFFPTTHVVCL